MFYIFWELLFQPIIWAIKKEVLSILRGVRFLLTQWDAYVNSILHCVLGGFYELQDLQLRIRECSRSAEMAKQPLKLSDLNTLKWGDAYNDLKATWWSWVQNTWSSLYKVNCYETFLSRVWIFSVTSISKFHFLNCMSFSFSFKLAGAETSAGWEN